MEPIDVAAVQKNKIRRPLQEANGGDTIAYHFAMMSFLITASLRVLSPVYTFHRPGPRSRQLRSVASTGTGRLFVLRSFA